MYFSNHNPCQPNTSNDSRSIAYAFLNSDLDSFINNISDLAPAGLSSTVDVNLRYKTEPPRIWKGILAHNVMSAFVSHKPELSENVPARSMGIPARVPEHSHGHMWLKWLARSKRKVAFPPPLRLPFPLQQQREWLSPLVSFPTATPIACPLPFAHQQLSLTLPFAL